MKTLTLDTTLLYSSQTPWNGLSADHKNAAQAQEVYEPLQKVEQKINSNEYGFIEVLKDEAFVKQVVEVLHSISWAKTLVVVGIGGSDLGGRVIQEALGSLNAPMKVLFHGDSTDPVQLQRLLDSLDLSSTVFNIISKSGETIETISQYVFFKAKYQEQAQDQNQDWSKHFVFTTDVQKGILRQEADTYGVKTLPIPDSVGGRFSVLTPVGLFPAAAMGVNLQELLTGALEFAQDTTARQLAQTLAVTQWQLWQKGTKVTVLMPYAVQLQEFGRWFRQLWAESLGKEGKGILPIKAFGPADQHSQLQFYNEGEMLQSFIFIRLEKRAQDFTLPHTDIEQVKYLSGHSFGEIINIEQESTALSLYKHGRASATLSVTELNAYSLGQLFLCFELAVVYLAELLHINAFDQPGVEESKQLMYGLLGREGFEVKN